MRMSNDRGFSIFCSIEDWKLHLVRHGKEISFAACELSDKESINEAMRRIKEELVSKEWSTTPHYLRKVREILIRFWMETYPTEIWNESKDEVLFKRDFTVEDVVTALVWHTGLTKFQAKEFVVKYEKEIKEQLDNTIRSLTEDWERHLFRNLKSELNLEDR